MPEAANAFDGLAQGLDEEHKAEFFRTLHDAGIGPQDAELARLLRALQLYKAYYESIPLAVQAAVQNMSRLKDGMEKLAAQSEQSVESGDELLDRLVREAAQVDESLSRLHSHVAAAADKAAVVVSKRMAELLTAAMEGALPLSDLATAGKTFSEAVAAGSQASAVLRANVKSVRRTYWLACALAALSMTLGMWTWTHSRYELRLEKERAAAIDQLQGNRDVLAQLQKSGRSLELRRDPKNPKSKFLYMDAAAGWTSTDRQGVIEFKE